MPEIKKYLNRDGLEEYNDLLPHSAGAMQEYVSDWLDAHPEATTTVQDGAITTQKLADSSVTRAKLAADVERLLGGVMITKEIEGELLTAQDAWSVAPLALAIEGKSTQAGTPTPDNPIPIVSLEALAISVHASADGTTDYGNWPVSVPLGQYVLRSLPDGTKDTLEITYLRPSMREGYAVYSMALVQRVMHSELTENTTGEWAFPETPNSNGIYNNSLTLSTAQFGEMFPNRTLANNYVVIGLTSIGVSNRGSASGATIPGLTAYPSTRRIYIRTDTQYDASSIAAMFTDGPVDIDYIAAEPITTQLDPVELTVLPAPNCTIWSDPTTGLKMSYMCNANIVVSNIEQAIADL